MDLQKIKISENLSNNITDSLNQKRNRLRGHVKIFEVDPISNKKTIINESKNLIVYSGRKWLLQRAFSQSTRNIQVGENFTADKDKYISWFGVGHDGCIQSDLLNPVYPVLRDQYLNHLSTNSLPSLIENSPQSYSENILSKTSSIYKGRLIRVSTNISTPENYNTIFEQDAENDDEYLIAKISVTLNKNQANFDNMIGSYSDINECGLFISNSNDSSTSSIFDDNSLTMFARYTFSTIRKYSERILVFEWYIYF